MKDGIYFEMFAMVDGKRYNAKIISVEEVSKILANSVMDGLGKVLGFAEANTQTEKALERRENGK